MGLNRGCLVFAAMMALAVASCGGDTSQATVDGSGDASGRDPNESPDTTAGGSGDSPGGSGEDGGTEAKDEGEDDDADAPGQGEPLPPTPQPNQCTGLPIDAFFTRNVGDAADARLEDLVIHLLGCAQPGSNVFASFYALGRNRAANAFVAAKNRGVNVRVIVERSNKANFEQRDGTGDLSKPTSAIRILLDGLGASNVVVCNRGCHGDKINHNKFMILSALSDGTTNVVLQSSQNLTGGQQSKHQNSVVVRNDAVLFQGYQRYWNDLARRQTNLDYGNTTPGKFGSGASRALTRPIASGNPERRFIEDVGCTAGNKRIRVAMSLFDENRIELAQALAQKAENGCDVQVVVNQSADMFSPQVRRALGNKVAVHFTKANWTTHSKYLLIDARWGDAGARTPRTLVFTGSSNWNNAFRRSDDVVLRIDDAATFAKFWDDWNKMRNRQ